MDGAGMEEWSSGALVGRGSRTIEGLREGVGLEWLGVLLGRETRRAVWGGAYLVDGVDVVETNGATQRKVSSGKSIQRRSLHDCIPASASWTPLAPSNNE